MQFVVVSGRSGSGKSSALHLLEDEGFTCIDNLPVSLLPELLKQMVPTDKNNAAQTNIAIGIDARNIDSDLNNLKAHLSNYSPDHLQYKVVYLDTSREILLKRFSETRRRHPLSDQNTGLNEAIAKEKEKLAPIAAAANITIDTSKLTLHELRSTIKKQVVGKNSQGLDVMFKSFGFKYGTPVDVDFMFDVRCLSNPHWNAELRSKTGLEIEVIEFLDAQEDVQKMLADLTVFLKNWIPSFEQNNRSYLTISIGCTGGKHRSVYIAEKLTQIFTPLFKNVQTRHRQFEQIPGQ